MADRRTPEEIRQDAELEAAERHAHDEWQERYGNRDIKEISRGDWRMGDDGLTESLVIIGESPRGFHYAVYRSYGGGDDYKFQEGIPWGEQAYPTQRAADYAAQREMRGEEEMPEETSRGILQTARELVAAHADALKQGAAMSLRERAAEIREAFGPERAEPVTYPERPFGRDEGGDDVKRVIWTSHTVQTPEGRAYFGAAGLTESGYYRAAEVQVYGSDELWRWQAERHVDKEDAIASAERLSASRLQEGEAPANGKEFSLREVFGKEQSNMAELPDHVKAQADAEMAKTGMQKAAVKDMDVAQPVDNYRDRGIELDAMREQKRQDAIPQKTPEATPEPGR
jgi:hypothetical protein